MVGLAGVILMQNHILDEWVRHSEIEIKISPLQHQNLGMGLVLG